MYNELQAPWIGDPDYDEFQTREEYEEEYYPLCECDE